MTKVQILIMLALIAAVCVLAVLYWIESAALKALQNAFKASDNRRSVFELFTEQETFGVPVVPRPADIIDLERECSTLRADVETGCSIINQQKNTINGLRRLLEQSQARNKTQKRLK